MDKRKLYRSQTERMVGGVCGGLAEYLDLDPTIVRLAFVALTLLGGHGLLIYIILLILMPLNPITVIQPPTQTITPPSV